MSLICSICTEDISSPQGHSNSSRNSIVTTKCGHIFHNLCIQQWLQRNQKNQDLQSSHKCPICQHDVNANDFIKIHGLDDESLKRKRSTTFALLKELKLNMGKTQQLIEKAEQIHGGILSLLDVPNEASSYSSSSDDDESSQNSTATVKNLTETLGGLRLNDRVVWMGNDNDDECAFGSVRWLGTIQNFVVAGVELDEAIGDTDGELDGKQLFSCEQDHGRFILVRELLMYEDFFEEKQT